MKPLKVSGSGTNVLASSSIAQLDFSPHGGVTFKENPGLNLQMVGTGFGDDSHPIEPKTVSYANKARERRRFGSKGKGMISSCLIVLYFFFLC
jgi:hypothetical protein